MDERAAPDAADFPALNPVVRETLADAVYRKCPRLSRRTAYIVVGEVLDEIIEGLGRDRKVMLSGFGCFRLNRKAPRIGRNPRTGELHEISARDTVTFSASRSMRRHVTQALANAAIGPRAACAGAPAKTPSCR